MKRSMWFKWGSHYTHLLACANGSSAQSTNTHALHWQAKDQLMSDLTPLNVIMVYIFIVPSQGLYLAKMHKSDDENWNLVRIERLSLFQWIFTAWPQQYGSGAAIRGCRRPELKHAHSLACFSPIKMPQYKYRLLKQMQQVKGQRRCEVLHKSINNLYRSSWICAHERALLVNLRTHVK